MERFTKEEDRTILDYYMSYGFHLTEKCVDNLSLLLNRTDKSIQNRMSRCLSKRYKDYLNRDFHIRVELIEKFNAGLKKKQSVDDILDMIANKFMMSRNSLYKAFYNNTNQYWGVYNLYFPMEGVPDTRKQLTDILRKEDDGYGLYPELSVQAKQKRQGLFRRIFEKLKRF